MSLKKLPIRAAAQLLLSAEGLFRRSPVSSGDSVLILEYLLPLGGCVHLTPVYEAIKQSKPHAQVTVSTRGLGLALLRHNPFVDDLIDTPDALASPRVTARSLQSSLKGRAIQPDLVLTGVSDQRSKIAITAMLASPAERGGFTVHPELYQKPLAYDRSLSLIDNNLKLALLAGASSEHREPRVFFSPSDAETARLLVHEVNPDGRPLIVFVTQNSGGQLTGWHIDRFAHVIRHAHQRLGADVAYVGIEKDRDAIEVIRSAADQIGTSLAGRTSVTQVAALLAMSDAVVSLDTGTMHIGRAVQAPLVVLGPSWQPPLEWLPLDIPWARILRGEDIDRKSIPKGYQLDEIQASDVIARLEEILSLYPPSRVSREKRVAYSLSQVDHLKRRP